MATYADFSVNLLPACYHSVTPACVDTGLKAAYCTINLCVDTLNVAGGGRLLVLAFPKQSSGEAVGSSKAKIKLLNFQGHLWLYL